VEKTGFCWEKWQKALSNENNNNNNPKALYKYIYKLQQKAAFNAKTRRMLTHYPMKQNGQTT